MYFVVCCSPSAVLLIIKSRICRVKRGSEKMAETSTEDVFLAEKVVDSGFGQVTYNFFVYSFSKAFYALLYGEYFWLRPEGNLGTLNKGHPDHPFHPAATTKVTSF